jgi:hypothetical protein
LSIQEAAQKISVGSESCPTQQRIRAAYRGSQSEKQVLSDPGSVMRKRRNFTERFCKPVALDCKECLAAEQKYREKMKRASD